MTVLREYFPTLGFVGAGNMAGALLRGTVGRGLLPPETVWACDIDNSKLESLRASLGIQVAPDLRALLTNCDTVMLAVKPQTLAAVLDAAQRAQDVNRLFISIAAGIPTRAIAARLHPSARIVRVMPNTPALVGRGAAGVAAGPGATNRDVEATLALMRAVGIAFEVEEDLIDSVTALSGSGPAYIFRLMEVMTESGIELGLAPDVARALTLQTVLGAAELAQQSGRDPAELRRQVTSPGGTTAAALEVLEQLDWGEAMKSAMTRARDRARELAQA